MGEARVVWDVSMSLDGFVAGPDDDVELLHQWLFDGRTDRDAIVEDAGVKAAGAVVMGRRTFDMHPSGPYGLPAFVVTHEARPEAGASPVTFVTDGVGSAIVQAARAAGGRSVAVMGADVARQCLTGGLVDELRIHLVPVLLGEGIRLYQDPSHGPIELERASVTPTAAATHLVFSIRGSESPGAAAR